GRSPTLSRIGMILNLVFMVIVVLVFVVIFASVPALQRNSRNTQRKNELMQVDAELQNFYNNHQYYPPSLSDLESPVPTTDPSGQPYVYTPAPDGCQKCTSFKLQTTLENGGAYELNSSASQ